MADDSDKPSYLRAAFLNVYNLSLLGGALTASAVTGEYVLGAVAAGAEALWLLFGPDLRPFRRAVDDSLRAEREKKEQARIQKMLDALPEREWGRARAIDELRNDIGRDMKQNPSFQYLLIQTEVDKLAQLYASFVSLAHACAKAETYLGQTDETDLARQIDQQKMVETSAKDETVAAIARKNVQVLEKRSDTIREIQNFLARARGQMNLIENSVRLLRDQVLTMQSPDQLGEQLDDLITGVDAVQSSMRESEAILGKIDVQPVSAVAGDGSATEGPRRVRG
jgi:hypothetical protein